QNGWQSFRSISQKYHVLDVSAPKDVPPFALLIGGRFDQPAPNRKIIPHGFPVTHEAAVNKGLHPRGIPGAVVAEIRIEVQAAHLTNGLTLIAPLGQLLRRSPERRVFIDPPAPGLVRLALQPPWPDDGDKSPTSRQQ